MSRLCSSSVSLISAVFGYCFRLAIVVLNRIKFSPCHPGVERDSAKTYPALTSGLFTAISVSLPINICLAQMGYLRKLGLKSGPGSKSFATPLLRSSAVPLYLGGSFQQLLRPSERRKSG